MTAREPMERVDCLGFDTYREALAAVATHPDWLERWDCGELTCSERLAIEGEADKRFGRFVRSAR